METSGFWKQNSQGDRDEGEQVLAWLVMGRQLAPVFYMWSALSWSIMSVGKVPESLEMN